MLYQFTAIYDNYFLSKIRESILIKDVELTIKKKQANQVKYI